MYRNKLLLLCFYQRITASSYFFISHDLQSLAAIITNWQWGLLKKTKKNKNSNIHGDFKGNFATKQQQFEKSQLQLMTTLNQLFQLQLSTENCTKSKQFCGPFLQ